MTYTDNQIDSLIDKEKIRQIEGAEIIASENYVSDAVLEAAGSICTNKYAEGYPFKRYYGGCEYIDQIEQLAIDRIKEIFKVEYANVQPHCGSNANLAVYLGLLEPGDTIMGLELQSGGHLTHGHFVSTSGIYYKAVAYSTDSNGLLDYDAIEKQAIEAQPKLIICGYSAYPREFDYKRFKAIADKVGAYLMADIAHIAWLIAGGVMENPCSICDVVTTTTHKTLRGPRGGVIMTNHEDVYKKIQKAVFPGLQGGPLENLIAAKAVAFGEILNTDFASYTKQVLKNTKAFEGVFNKEWIKMTTGGSDNHLLVLDMRSIDLTGKEAEKILGDCDITCNKNTVPDETGSPMNPSGIRIGTPALTTRGFVESDIEWLASIMIQALRNPEDTGLHGELKKQVNTYMKKFPLFQYS